MKRLYLIFILLLILPFVQAVPFQATTNGMQIEYPKYDFIQAGKDFRFHVHVINETAYKTNKTTSCILHIYNQTGYDINISSNMEFEGYNGVDFATTVPGGNFSTEGYYSYVFQCNSTNQIAFASGQLKVTNSGLGDPDTGASIIYLMQFLIILVISFTSFFIFGKVENKAARIFLSVIGLIGILVAILHVVLLTDIYSIDKINDSFAGFYTVIQVAASIGVLALLIVVGIVIYKSWRYKRGYDD